MTRRRFYRHALWLPILLPLLCGLFIASPTNKILDSSGALGVAILMMAFSPFFYIVPYAFFAFCVAKKTSQMSLATLKRISWFLPIYFSPLCTIFGGVFAKLTSDNYTIQSMLKDMSWFLIIALAFGYFYVVLAHLLCFFFSKIGWLKED